jgi:hypothetical protein
LRDKIEHCSKSTIDLEEGTITGKDNRIGHENFCQRECKEAFLSPFSEIGSIEQLKEYDTKASRHRATANPVTSFYCLYRIRGISDHSRLA